MLNYLFQLVDDFIAHNDVSEVIVEETSMIDKLNSINK